MNNNLFIILIILRNAITQKTNYIQNQSLRNLSEEKIQEQVNYFYRHIMDIKIGSPPQYLRVKLSSSFCGLWLQDSKHYSSGFNSDDSVTFARSITSGSFEFVTGQFVQDTVEFVSIANKYFPFLLVNQSTIKEDHDYQGIIGFGYHCDFTNQVTTDVLAYLNSNSIYKMKLFYFRLNAENGGGWFSIGQLPKGFNANSQYYRKTPVDTQNISGQWKVMLDSIYFEDGQFWRIKDKISIGIGGSILSVTKNVFLQVADKYFRKLINSNECEMNSEKIYEIVCNEDVVPPKIGVLSFIVGKWNFKVNAAKLFIVIPRLLGRKLWFGMVHYPDQNEYYISQLFLKGISIIYHKENNEIGFYNKTQ